MALDEAFTTGDLDLAASAGRHLGRTLDSDALTATVGDLLTPSLHHLPRAMPRSPLAGAMFAADVVGSAISTSTDVDAAERTILRTAAASMLLDDPAHAPYGWSHCLTIPQGILATLRTSTTPSKTLALAATHVVGFRAALGSAPLAELVGHAGRIGSDALVPGIDRPALDTLQAAIDFAAGHEDAHLTKYVVSCMDAARRGPVGAHQYLAAAVHLADWWRALED